MSKAEMAQIVEYERLEYRGNSQRLEQVSNASELDEANWNASQCSSLEFSDEECAQYSDDEWATSGS
jgi:hypothetical protein